MTSDATQRPGAGASAGGSLDAGLRAVARAIERDWQGPQVALQLLAREAAAALAVARVSVWLYEEGKTSLRCMHAHVDDDGSSPLGTSISAGDFPAYFRALTGEQLVAAGDALTDERTAELGEYLRAHGVTSLLDAPIWVAGRMTGVVCHEHRGAPRTWSPEEESYAGAIGDVASLVLATAQRVDAEQALSHHEGRYGHAFDASPVALVECDLTRVREEVRRLAEESPEGLEAYFHAHPGEVERVLRLLVVEEANDAALTLYGASSAREFKEALRGRILPRSDSFFRDVLLALASGATTVDGEAVHRTVTGRRLDVRLACRLPRAQAPEARSVMSIEDITSLRTSESMLRDIAEGLGAYSGPAYIEHSVEFIVNRLGADLALVGTVDPDVATVTSLAAIRDGHVVDDLTYPLAGSPCAEVVGRRPCTFVHGVCDLFPEDRGLALLGAQAYVGAPIMASDGSPLGIAVAAYKEPLDDARLVESVLQIVATRAGGEIERQGAERQRGRLEAELAQAQRLESVGRLAGGIAHDFNNLLAPIIAYCEMAMDVVDEDHPVREDLQEIGAAAERASRLTRQLLAFGKRQVLELRPIRLDEVVAGFTSMLHSVLRDGAKLEVVPGPSMPCVHGDVGQIEQVLMNLVVNARDAMPGGGQVTVSTETHEVVRGAEDPAELSPGRYVCLSVRDTGTGMDEATRTRIFEPFFTTKPSSKGTGLGLATAYGIVQQHGGAITVVSTPGEGTTFRLFFPVPTGDAEPAEPERQESVEPSPVILVVEDEDVVRRLVVNVLRRQGYAVLDAGTPSRALELASDGSIGLDLLLTDVVMPEMDGVELYRHVSRTRPGLPVLYISGYAHDVIADRGVASMNLLAKPFSLKELVERVRGLFEQMAEPAGTD